MTVDEVYLTIPEVAQRLDVHPNTVRKLIRDGKLGHQRLSRTIRIPVTMLDEYIAAATFSSAA